MIPRIVTATLWGFCDNTVWSGSQISQMEDYIQPYQLRSRVRSLHRIEHRSADKSVHAQHDGQEITERHSSEVLPTAILNATRLKTKKGSRQFDVTPDLMTVSPLGLEPRTYGLKVRCSTN